MAEPGLTPEQMLEQLRGIKVSDLVLSTALTLAQLGYVKLDRGSRDLEQARLAIETLRTLVPVLRDAVDPEIARDLDATVTNLQLAYVAATQEGEQRPAAAGDGDPAPAGDDA